MFLLTALHGKCLFTQSSSWTLSLSFRDTQWVHRTEWRWAALGGADLCFLPRIVSCVLGLKVWAQLPGAWSSPLSAGKARGREKAEEGHALNVTWIRGLSSSLDSAFSPGQSHLLPGPSAGA